MQRRYRRLGKGRGVPQAIRVGGMGLVTSWYRLPFGAAVPEAELGAACLERSWAVAQGSGGEKKGLRDPRGVCLRKGKEDKKRAGQGVTMIIRIL